MRVFRLIMLACVFLQPAMAEGVRNVDVEHYLTYSAKGSRSEVRHGHLRINGIPVPYGFTRVVVAGQTFTTLYRRYHWGEDGYHPMHRAFNPPEFDANLSEEALQKGYVLSAERHQNMPADWFYVEWGDGSAFVTPRALDTLIQEQQILTFFSDQRGPQQPSPVDQVMPSADTPADKPFRDPKDRPESILDGPSRETRCFPDLKSTKEVVE